MAKSCSESHDKFFIFFATVTLLDLPIFKYALNSNVQEIKLGEGVIKKSIGE